MITSENRLIKKIFADEATEEKPEEVEAAASPFGAKVGQKGKLPTATLQRSRTMPAKSSGGDAAPSSNASKVSVTKKFKAELQYLIPSFLFILLISNFT